jgi:hypothetical protein
VIKIRLSVLENKNRKGKGKGQLEDLVTFMSRKITNTKLRYLTPNGELLAIQEAFRTWRHYLAYLAYIIKVIIDYLNYKYLTIKPKLTSK